MTTDEEYEPVQRFPRTGAGGRTPDGRAVPSPRVSRRTSTARLAAWPDGLRLVEHPRGAAAPLRLPDPADYARSLGCSPLPIPCRALLGTPMRHRDAPAGGFFLAQKEGGFTEADEAVPALFAAAGGGRLCARRHSLPWR